MIAAGADVCALNSGASTPLHRAAALQRNSAAVVPILVEAGADVNAVNKYNSTPLSLAITIGPEDALCCVLTCLLDGGADVAMRAWDGKSMVDLAAEALSAATQLLALGVAEYISRVRYLIAAVRLLFRATVWQRRRHLLLLLRSRIGGARAAAPALAITSDADDSASGASSLSEDAADAASATSIHGSA